MKKQRIFLTFSDNVNQRHKDVYIVQILERLVLQVLGTFYLPVLTDISL